VSSEYYFKTSAYVDLSVDHCLTMPISFSQISSAVASIGESTTHSILNDKALLDPVGKLRVANPETLIDTDFEYGLQTTKWETVETVNNIPTFFSRDNDLSMPVTKVLIYPEQYNIYVFTESPHNLTVGTPVIVQGVSSYSAEGTFLVTQIVDTNTFTYIAKTPQVVENAEVLDISSQNTSIYVGKMYQGTQYNLDSLGYINTNDNSADPSIEVDTIYPHGFSKDTNFVLSRSVGHKQVKTYGSNIDIRDTLSFSKTTDLASNVDGGTNSTYKDRIVTLHDWESKATSYFGMSNVDVGSNTISIPGHAFSSNDYVMYMPAPYLCSGMNTALSNIDAQRHYASPSMLKGWSNYVDYGLDTGSNAGGGSISTGTSGLTGSVSSSNNMFLGGINAASIATTSAVMPLMHNANTNGLDVSAETVVFNYNNVDTLFTCDRISLTFLRGTYQNRGTTALTLTVRIQAASAYTTLLTLSVPGNNLTVYNLRDLGISSTFTSGTYKRVEITSSVAQAGGTLQNVNGTIIMSSGSTSLTALPYGNSNMTLVPGITTSNVEYKYIHNGTNAPLALVTRLPQSTTAWLTSFDTNVASNLGTAERSSVTQLKVESWELDGPDATANMPYTLNRQLSLYTNATEPTTSASMDAYFAQKHSQAVVATQTFAMATVPSGSITRFTGFFSPPTTGSYTLSPVHSGAVEIAVKFASDGVSPGTSADAWTYLIYSTPDASVPGSQICLTKAFQAGGAYPFRVRYHCNSYINSLQLWWKTPTAPTVWNEVPFTVFSSPKIGTNRSLGLSGSYYYWGNYGFGTSKPSVYHLVVGFHMSPNDPALILGAPSHATSTDNKTVSVVSMQVSSSTVSPAYVVNLLLTRSNGARITSAEMTEMAQLVMAKYQNFVPLCDSINVVNPYRYAPIDFSTELYAVKTIGPDCGRMFIDGVALPQNRRYWQSTSNPCIKYKVINKSVNLAIMRTEASITPSAPVLRFMDADTGSITGTTVAPAAAYNFVTPNQVKTSSVYCTAFYWGVYNNRGAGNAIIPSVYNVIVMARIASSASYPSLVWKSATSTTSLLTMDQAFTVSTGSCYIFKALLSRPSGGIISVSELQSVARSLAAYGTTLGGEEDNIRFNSIGGTVGHNLYRVVPVTGDASKVKLYDVPPSLMATENGSSQRFQHAAVTISSGSFSSTFYYNNRSFDVTTDFIDFAAMTPSIILSLGTATSGATYTRTFDIGYYYINSSGGTSITIQRSVVLSTPASYNLTGYMNSVATDVPVRYTGIYIRRLISPGTLPYPIDTVYYYANSVMFGGVRQVSTIPLSLNPYNDNTPASHTHALCKAFPVRSTSGTTYQNSVNTPINKYNLLRKNTDTMSIIVSDKVWFCNTPTCPFGGNVIKAFTNVSATDPNYVLTAMVTNVNSLSIGLKTTSGSTVSGSRQLPATAWAVVGQRILGVNSIYAAAHGMNTGDAITLVPKTSPGSLCASTVLPGLTYYASVLDSNRVQLKQNNVIVDLLNIDSGPLDFNFITSNATANSITIRNHGLVNNSTVIYDSSLTPVSIGGLSHGTTYYISNVKQNTFQLSTTAGGSPINLTDASGTIPSKSVHKFNVSSIGATDGTFTISETNGIASVLTLKAPFPIPPKSIPFNPLNSVNLSENTLFLFKHCMSTGSSFTYNGVGIDGTPVSPLIVDQGYFATRIDDNNIRVSQSYQDVLNGVYVTLEDHGAGKTHELTNYSIGGQIPSDKKLSIPTISTSLIKGEYDILTGEALTRFQSEFKIGNRLDIIVPPVQYADYRVYSVDPVAFTVTLTTAVNFPATTLDVEGNMIPWFEAIAFAPTHPVLSSNVSVLPLAVTTDVTDLLGINADNIVYASIQGTAANGGSIIRIFHNLVDASANSNPMSFTSSIGTVLVGADKTVSAALFITVVRPSDIVSCNIIDIRNNKLMVSGELTSKGVEYVTPIADCRYFTSTNLLVKSDGFALHRPYDGGVELVPPKNADSQMVRQTRKYFRYQSGKGIQLSMAVNFSCPVDLQYLKYVSQTEAAAGAYRDAYDDAYKTAFETVYDSSYQAQYVANPDVDPTAADITATEAALAAALAAGVLAGNAASASAVAHGLCKTRKSHKLSVGIDIRIDLKDMNGSSVNEWTIQTVKVASLVTEGVFTFDWPLGKAVPSTSTAPGIPQVAVLSWTGSALRCGLFDDQNGIFFEYDGQELYAVRRCSTKQLTGSSSIEFNKPTVTGNSESRFSTQVVVGDRVVIKGQSYKVVSIPSDNIMYIQPAYRGVTARDVILSRTEDRRDRRDAWSDKCDGSGESGYNLDIHKIQMVYMDYSWYGAGKVRFGFRAADGGIVYVHTMVHNNHLTEAYMRSGNIPARYEVQNIGYPTYVPSIMHWGTSVIMDGRYDLDKAYMFTASGQVLTYTGNKPLTVGAVFTSVTTVNASWPVNKQFSVFDTSTGATVLCYAIAFPISQYNALQNIRSGTTVSSLIGTAFVNNNATGYTNSTINFFTSGTSGGSKTTSTTVSQPFQFNATYGLMYVRDAFAFPTVAGVSVTSFQRFTSCAAIIGNITSENIPSLIPLISIRLAPSVDNSLTGQVGLREIINRMQLTLRDIGTLTSHDCEIRLMLNSFPDNKTWQKVTSPSLTQLLYHQVGDTIDGGTNIFSFRASGGVPDTSNKRSAVNSVQDLSDLVTLGNSILGGDGIFPDGPDLLTVCASPLDLAGISVASPFTITSRITWTESQA